MSQYHDLISQTILFEGLPDHHIRDLLKIAREREFVKNELIFSEGDAGNGFYIGVDGMIKIFKLSSEGKEQIFHIFGPGEPFGEVPVFSGQTFPANAEAITKSRALFFPRAGIISLIEQNPSLALNMLAVLSLRLRRFTVQIENLSLKEVPGRLAAHLIMLYIEQRGKHTIALNISKSQLAALLGTIPETLSRILAKMAGQGLIDVQGRQITLLDIGGLELLAQTGRLLGVDSLPVTEN
ncbi:MAG: Crp/Fnr family transcriptional regulator [Desulfobacteraceae bacterium]|nr:Crp/Fnr family transcriptional regulator [Desulfobacteraceae bacterium]